MVLTHLLVGVPNPESYFCDAKVTNTFLKWIAKDQKPKLAVSENVVSGNINQRVVEALEDGMDSRAT